MSHLRQSCFAFLSIITLIDGFSSPPPPPPPPLNNLQNGLSSDSNQTGQDEQTAEQKEPSDIYRLTDDVVPTSYELRIAPDLRNFTFIGKVEIAIRVKFTTNKIILHSKNLVITSVKVFKIDTSSMALLNTDYKLDKSNDLLIVRHSQLLSFNTNYSLIIEFRGVLSRKMRGLYLTSYTVKNEKKWIAVTHFEPNYAREAFPCFDEPRFRTPFTIYLARHPDQLAVSNMPSESWLPSDSISGADRRWEKFQKSPAMPTYLVAYMVSDFHNIQTKGNIRLIAKKNSGQQGAYALKQATRALGELEGYTGISYNLPKLDMVAVPDLPDGGMENWGMVTFSENSLLTDESSSSAQHRQVITQLISHEFAHLWFGDLVTPAWYSYLWLKEGMATYFESIITSAIEPTWNFDQLFVIENVQESLQLEVATQRPMTTFVRKSNQIDDLYDIISYQKAASIIRMFEHALSPNTFRTALHNFLTDGEKIYGGVTLSKNLFDAFDIEAQRSSPSISPQLSVAEIMKPWTENIGYPLIKVFRYYDDETVEITQSLYQDITVQSILPFQNWIVPLTYTTKSRLQFSDTRPTNWSTADHPIEIREDISNGDWILFNLQNVGYYRVNYDMKNWNLLIEQLHQDHEKIHVLNRAQLIRDAYALAYDEYVTYQVPLKLTEYLVKETDMIAWYAAIKAFNTLQLRLQDTASEGFFKKYLYDLFKKSYETIGYKIKSTDSHVVKVVKPQFLMLACNMGIQDCIQKSLDEYEKNKADLTEVQPDLKPVVYCHALRNSTDQRNVFNNLWSTYMKYDVLFEKQQILTALACASDEEVIKGILSKMIDPKNNEIRKNDESYFLDHLNSQPETVTATIKFINEQANTMTDSNKVGHTFLQELLSSMKFYIKTQEQLKQLNEIRSKFSLLNQDDYWELIETLDGLISISVHSIKNAADTLDRVQNEFLNSDNSVSEITDMEAQGSATSISILKFVWYLFSTSLVLCYASSFKFSVC